MVPITTASLLIYVLQFAPGWDVTRPLQPAWRLSSTAGLKVECNKMDASEKVLSLNLGDLYLRWDQALVCKPDGTLLERIFRKLNWCPCCPQAYICSTTCWLWLPTAIPSHCRWPKACILKPAP